jgi:uncharacterized RDD family membrane protein YckC
MNMKTLTSFWAALVAVALFGGIARAQDAPAVERPADRAPAVEAQDAPGAQRAPEAPPAPEAPRAPDAPATPSVEREDDATNDPAATASAEDEGIVWTTDRGRGRGSVRFDSHGDGFVTVFGSSTLPADRRADSVVSVFGSSTSSGEVRDVIVSVFGDTRVEAGSVGDTAAAVFGNNYVNAPVDGDVIAVLGDVELGTKADVRGELIVIGGMLRQDPAARVRGAIQHVLTVPAGTLTGLRAWLENAVRFARPLAFGPGLGLAWTVALGFLALYAFIALMLREPVDRCVETLQRYPGQTALASFLAMLLTPLALMVLVFTIIGIPIVMFGIFLATLFGKAVVLAWIGRGLLKFMDDGEKLHSAVAVLAGGAVVALMYTVPVLGFLLFNVLGILAFGVVVYTVLLALKARRRNAPPPAFATAPGGPGVPPSNGGPTFTASESGFAPNGSSRDSAPSGTYSAASTAAEGTSTADVPGGMSASGAAPGAELGGASGTTGAAGAGGYVPPSSAQAVMGNAATLPRAGFWIRMLALLIDAILVGVVISVLSDENKLQLIALATYGAIMWKMKGTTVGGIVCNLKVIRVDGQPLDWSTSIVRALSCFLSLIVVGLGFIWIAFDEGIQSWHAKIAGTVVVPVPQGVSRT